MTQVIRAACVIYRDLELAGQDYDREDFQERMIERLLTLPFALPEHEQLWFLERMDGFSDVNLEG